METLRLLGRLALGVMLCMVIAAGAAAQTATPVTPKDLVGVWEGSAQTPNGEVTLKVVFALTDDKLVATIESSMGPMPVSSTTLTDDKLAMQIQVGADAASLAATVKGPKIEGTWTLGAESGPFSLAKTGGTESGATR